MTTQQATAHSLFISAFEAAPRIEFNTEWKNKTGYLDFVCEENLGLEEGQIVSCIDDLNRKMLIKGMGQGFNHVIFERGVRDVLVSNMPHPRLIKNMPGFASSLNINAVELFLGQRNPSITFNPDFYEDLFVDNGIEITDEIKNRIEQEQTWTFAEVEAMGIDPYSGLTAQSIIHFHK